MTLLNEFALDTARVPEPSRWLDASEKEYLNQLVKVLKANFDSLERQFKKVTPVKYGSLIVDAAGTYSVDMKQTVYLIDATLGAVTAELPNAAELQSIGRQLIFKKIDVSANTVDVTEDAGLGPDGATQTLTTQYEAVTVFSDGNAWHILSKY